MDKPFLVFTSPVNEKLLETAPEEFYSVLTTMFKVPFSLKNTGMSYDARLNPDKMHVFEKSDYIGFINVIDEESLGNEAISTKH